MGQSSGRLKKQPPVVTKENAAVPIPPLYDMFNPEKLATLSYKLAKISLNEIEEDNGLVFQGRYIPEEVLIKILGYIDYKSLVVCQLVCKQWFLIIRHFVWRREAERLLHRQLPIDEKAVWTVFYAVCKNKIPFNENLIKVENCFWVNLEGIHWYLTEKYFKAPKDPMFHGKSLRCIISNGRCWNRQVLNLILLGFPQYLLDNMQPTIKVSEWYRCRRDSPGEYKCRAELVKLEEKLVRRTVKSNDVVLDSYQFTKTFENRNHRGTWRKMKCQFRNYGKGLNRIRYYHGGQNHVEIGGTSIIVEVPSLKSKDRNVERK